MMIRNRLFFLSAAGILLLSSLSCVWVSEFGTSPEIPPAYDGPISVNASSVALSRQSLTSADHTWSWELNVKPDGEAVLNTTNYIDKKEHQLRIPKERMESFRMALIEERFFELPEELGQRVPDSGWQELTVTIDDRSKTINIRFLMNWVHSEPEKLVEPARGIRVFDQVRSWFDVPEALGAQPQKNRVLEAARPFEKQKTGC